MDIEITLSVVCEGRYLRGSPDYFSGGCWNPGDPEDVEDFQVFLVKGDKKIEITDYLTEGEIIKLQTEFIEEQGEE